VVAALAALAVGSASAIDVSWQIIKPSNTGIPGEEVRVVRFAPDGKLWVGARWPFWREGGRRRPARDPNPEPEQEDEARSQVPQAGARE